MTSPYTVPPTLTLTNARESSLSLLARVFDSSLQTHYSFDKIATNTYSTSLHPGILLPSDAMVRVQAYIASHPDQQLHLQRTGPKGNFYLGIVRDLVTYRYLVGPWSYASLITTNVNRRLRRILMQSSCLSPYAPPVESPLGNVISHDHLIDLHSAEVSMLNQAEAATTIEAIAHEYAEAAMAIFGLSRLGRANSSLTGIEIDWDIACADPDGLIRSYARAVSANLLPRPRPYLKAGAAIRPPLSPAPIYMLVGLSPRFKLVIYPKLAASPGGRGVARFEFRFRKKQIKTILGTTVMPHDRQGIADAIGKLAAHAWPTLLALEDDRTAPIVAISPRDLLNAVGGLRNQGIVTEVLDILAADGKIRVTNRNRRIVARLEQRDWLRPLLFRRPAYRKLAPGLDLSAWRRGSHEARAIDDAIANPITGGHS